MRTYKRRNRGEQQLGPQGSTSLLTDGDDELGPLGSRKISAGKFSQDNDENEPNSSFWSSSQQARLSFSLPSSQGSSGFDDDGILRASTMSIQSSELQQELGKNSDTPTLASTDSHKGKCEKTFSAGQKLIKAESLLKNPKTSSSGSAGHVKTRVTSSVRGGQARATSCLMGDDHGQARGNGHGQTRATSSSIGDGHGQARATSSVTGDGHIQARATSSVMGNETEVMAASAKIASVMGPCAPPTSTLLEAQESGEMMEHMDEVNFAMDGLGPGQPLSIRRASLISLLSIFGTRQRRRLLRTHGMLKAVLDAVLTVPTDDSATALAAAALLYVMACDGQDEDFLDSPACIHFLMKLLGPSCPPVQEKRLSVLGSRLLALGSHAKSNRAEVSTTGVDQGGTLVVDKVKYLLSTMKEWRDEILKPDYQSASFPGEALSSEWLVLLTFEKACLSTVVLEDNAGSVRRVGGYFKERLRELGGLDAVCELASNCFLNLRKVVNINMKTNNCLQQNILMKGSRGVGVLLRCLKVMENVTFLSENNQKHLLDMILLKNTVNSPHTFIGVVVGTINMISDFILARRYQQEVTSYGSRDGNPKVDLKGKHTLSHNGVYVKKSQKLQTLKLQGKEFLGSEGKASGSAASEKRAPSEQSLEGHKVKGSFEFDELDWSIEKDSVKTQVFKRQKCQSVTKSVFFNDTSAHSVVMENDEMERPAEEPYENLLEDCLLSAVKVLMNLTNDNDLGCRQVAADGGLDAVALLIAKHFPSFQSVSLKVRRRNGEDKGNNRIKQESDANHQDQDLDLLVVVLGVLVNLVEKDTRNRGRLVSLNTEGSHHALNGSVKQRDHGIITLLCSIFLSKEGTGRAIESTGCEIDAESSFKQGQQEAEDMILEAYSALLLAFLSKESLIVRSAIAKHLPEGNLSTLVPVLERFLAFHLSLNMLSAETHETVRDVIESCK